MQSLLSQTERENEKEKGEIVDDDEHQIDEEEEEGAEADESVNIEVLQPVKERQLTFRAVFVGILVGGLLCTSNVYYGLKTGWTTMGSLQSAIAGFAIFRGLSRLGCLKDSPFTAKENVVVQTAGVAAASMALAGGFVGPLNSIEQEEKMRFSTPTLLIFSLALAQFGAFLAVPLRKQTIIVENLKFPSGTATAATIAAMHSISTGGGGKEGEGLKRRRRNRKQRHQDKDDLIVDAEERGEKDKVEEETEEEAAHGHHHGETLGETVEGGSQGAVLLIAMAFSFVFKLITFFVPALENLPIFSWFGAKGVTDFGWTLYLSLGHIGQGVIMGMKTTTSVLFGAILGWAVIGPIARAVGSAPGPISSLSNGAKGWTLWLAVGIMTSESFAALFFVVWGMVKRWRAKRGGKGGEADKKYEDPAPPEEQVPLLWWSLGLVLSSLLCVIVISVMFNLPFYQPLIATILAVLLSVIAVRALGETDLNPVSGIGKVSQIVFAAVAPGQIVSNLISGAIAEAGALQAGDMMQDLKTGHILRASPRAQFLAQVVSVSFSVVFAVGSYKLFCSVYEIPGPEFSVPSASVWTAMAKLLQQGTAALPPHVPEACAIAAVISLLCTIASYSAPHRARYLPSMMAVGIGMYVDPYYSIARWIGALLFKGWMKKDASSAAKFAVPIASGLVAGEGMGGLFAALLRAWGVGTVLCTGCTVGFSCGACGKAGGGGGEWLLGAACVGIAILVLGVWFVLKQLRGDQGFLRVVR